MKNHQLLSILLLSPFSISSSPAWAASSIGAHPSIAATSQELSAEVQALIHSGRAALAAGNPEEALGHFESADEKSSQAPDAHVWVLRAWMDMGRLNDALNDADRMRQEGVDTAGLDYIYGMGSFQRAKNLLDQGGNPGLAFGDAVSYLQATVDRDDKTYSDAWLNLAHASWYLPELDRAKKAIAKAIEHEPNSARVRTIEGEIFFSSYISAIQNKRADEEVGTEDAQAALAAFGRAAELTPKDNAEGPKHFAIWHQIGNVHAWLKDMPKASESFAEALSWAPEQMNFNQMWQTVVQDGDMKVYNATIQKGLEGYKKRFGEDATGAANLLWWLGYGQMSGKEFEAAEASFRESFERNKTFANSWYYVGLTRYHRQDYQGACDGWLAYWDLDPGSLVATIRGDETAVPIMVYAAGKMSEQGYTRGGTIANLETAERMNQVLAGAQPTNTDHWNNLGLLRRDIGESTWRANRDGDPKVIVKIYKDSFKAYNKAVTLSDEDPGYLNDAAVILQYYLGEDIDRARDYYNRAHKAAAARVEEESWTKLPEDQRAAEETRIRNALKDSKDNLAKLDAGEVGTRGPRIEEESQIEAGAPK